MKLNLFTALLALMCVAIPGARAFTSADYRAAESLFANDQDLSSFRTADLDKCLLDIALNIGGDPAYFRTRALALAWAVASDDLRNEIIKADFYFRLGRIPKDDPVIGIDPTHEGLIASVSNCAVALSSFEAAGNPGGLTDLTKDLLLQLNKRNGNYVSFDFESTILEETMLLRKEQWDRLVPEVAALRDSQRLSKGRLNPGAVPELGTQGANNAEMISGEGVFAGKQSSLNGLLVMELEGSEYAGDASRMNATATGSDAVDRPSIIRFSQSVGPMMSGALSEVERFLAVRHDGLPRGHEVTISFDERATMKDGPSAAVACGLLLESLITGTDLDSSFAVTGDMNADGKVQPVGGIDGKIRGAVKAGCTHVGLPYENMKSVSDIFILNGPAEVCKIQIFSISDFSQAMNLAIGSESRDPKLAESMKLFSEIATVIRRPGGTSMVSNPHVVERLRKVIELTPNHYSAELLLRSALGSAPTSLSLAGSFVALDRCIKPMNAVRESRDFASKLEPLKDSIFNLRRVRNLLDPRTKPVSDGIEDLYEALTDIEPGMQVNGPRFKAAIDALNLASDKLEAAYAKLRSDPEVQEELNM